MDEQKKEALIRAVSILTSNAAFCAKQAAAGIERLRRAKSPAEAAQACQSIFGWIDYIATERKYADSALMHELGRLWEFD